MGAPKLRMASCLGWLFGLGLLAVLVGWVVLRFALPRPEKILVGSAQDFQPGQAPRMFWHGSTPFYIVNTEGELLALYARSTRGVRCLIRWDAERLQYVDPCYGSRMQLNGKYEGGGPPLEMGRLALQVIDGQVWVSLQLTQTTPRPGLSIPFESIR